MDQALPPAEDPPAGPGKEVLSKAWAAGLKLRQEVLNARATAAELERAITTEPAWGWASNPQNLGRMQQAMQEFNMKMGDQPFLARLMTEKVAEVKQSMTPQALKVELAKMEDKSFQKTLRALTNTCSQLQKRHAISD